MLRFTSLQPNYVVTRTGHPLLEQQMPFRIAWFIFWFPLSFMPAPIAGDVLSGKASQSAIIYMLVTMIEILVIFTFVLQWVDSSYLQIASLRSSNTPRIKILVFLYYLEVSLCCYCIQSYDLLSLFVKYLHWIPIIRFIRIYTFAASLW